MSAALVTSLTEAGTTTTAEAVLFWTLGPIMVIAALGQRALVTEHAESTVAGMREFAFKHALTYDVAYGTLPRAERRELHRQVGAWVEDVAPGREAEMAELAAYHLDRYAGIADYAGAKARIFAQATVQVLNRDDPIVRLMRRKGRTVQTFGAGVPLSEEEWGLVQRPDGAWLARGGELVMQASRLALVGRHNALNALASLALASSVAKIGRPVLDVDIACPGPERAARAYQAEVGGAVFPLSERHGAWRVAFRDGRTVDFTPLPEGIEADLRTRDFAVNAIARPLGSREYVDPLGGLADLDARRLRVVTDEAFDDLCLQHDVR